MAMSQKPEYSSPENKSLQERLNIDQNNQTTYRLPYPRKRFERGLTRIFGRIVLPIFFKLEVVGEHNYPESGPLIVVANHEAVMELFMLESLPPWQIEMLGQADLPLEKLEDVFSNFFGFIPIRRGHIERESLGMALDVLHQDGVIGLYPEGGVWDAGAMRAQSGVSWLSYRGKANVLPIAFSGTAGALGHAFRLRRPKMAMRIGEVIPAACPPKDISRKVFFQQYAANIMETIRSMIPDEEKPQGNIIRNERFELEIDVQTADGDMIDYPNELKVQHDKALCKVLFRPTILKIFSINLDLPTEPLERLDQNPDVHEIENAVRTILDYLREDNPYLLTYRFGPKEAEAMQLGLSELHTLTEWVINQGFELRLKPIRRYYLANCGEEVVQTKQTKFEDWM